MIDTHAHLNFKDFKNDYQEVIARSFDNKIKAIINVGSNFETSQRAIQIAKEFEKKKIGIFAAIGLHPIHTGDERFQEEKYAKIIKENKDEVRAIGEIGLDYFHLFQEVKDIKKQKEVIEKQKDILIKQISLAKEFNLPVIFHSRSNKDYQKSYLDILEILDNLKFSLKGVIHCFSGDWQIAQKFLDKGFYLGFNGIITFPNFKYQEVIKNTALERILLETDCPYLAPQAVRGTRNEPKNLFYIAQEIAKIKKISFTKLNRVTDQNAQRLFRII